MKRTKLVIIIATVLTVSLLLGAQRNPKKWEYARLSYGKLNKWYWSTSDISAEGANVEELCKNLSIEAPQTKKNVLTIVEWAGSQGWELAVVVKHQKYSVGWFKRPK